MASQTSRIGSPMVGRPANSTPGVSTNLPLGLNLIELLDKAFKPPATPKPAFVSQIRKLLATARPLIEEQYRVANRPSPYLNLLPQYNPSIPNDVDKFTYHPQTGEPIGPAAGRSPNPVRAQVQPSGTASPIIPPAMTRTNTSTHSIASTSSSPIQPHASPTINPAAPRPSGGMLQAQTPAQAQLMRTYCAGPCPRPQPPPGKLLPPQLSSLVTWSDVYNLPTQYKAVYFQLAPPGTQQTLATFAKSIIKAGQDPALLARQVVALRQKNLTVTKDDGSGREGQGGVEGDNAGGTGMVLGGAGLGSSTSAMPMSGVVNTEVVKPKAGTLQEGIQSGAASHSGSTETGSSMVKTGSGHGDVKGEPTSVQPAAITSGSTSLPISALPGSKPSTIAPPLQSNAAGPPAATDSSGNKVIQLTQSEIHKFRAMSEADAALLSPGEREKYFTFRKRLMRAQEQQALKAAPSAAVAGIGASGPAGAGSVTRESVEGGGGGSSTPRHAGSTASIDLTQDVKPTVQLASTPQAINRTAPANTPGNTLGRPPNPQVHRGNINDRVRAILAAEGGISAERIRQIYREANVAITEVIDAGINAYVAGTIQRGVNNTRPPTPPPPPISVRDLAHERIQAILAAENDGMSVNEEVSNFYTDFAEGLFSDQLTGACTVHSALDDFAETHGSVQMKDVALYAKHVYQQSLSEYGLESGFGILDTSNKRRVEALPPVRAKRLRAINALKAGKGLNSPE